MVTAILGEQVHMAFPDVSILIPLIREGKLKRSPSPARSDIHNCPMFRP
jgi:hypothetical protein